MAEHKQAVIVGALGVIGRYIVARLLGQGDWSVVGLSRRTADAAPRYRHIAVDLLDAEATAEKLAGLNDATHVFYAAFSPRPALPRAMPRTSRRTAPCWSTPSRRSIAPRRA